ncbi:MAG: molybdenum cofactor guanylyltransferase [Promethearchaeota archaeon]
MLESNQKNKYLAFTILIGGKSARFGSDKGIFEFLGKPLISYQLDTILKFNMNIYLVAHSRKQVQEYEKKINTQKISGFILDNKKVISDVKLRTPMIGLFSAFEELQKLGFQKVFMLSCDTPLINYDVINFMIKQSKNYDCCIPKWENGFLEPLFAIYPVENAFLKAKKNIENQLYKLINILDPTWKINYISIEKEIKPYDEKLLTFININGPIDIEKLMEIYKSD